MLPSSLLYTLLTCASLVTASPHTKTTTHTTIPNIFQQSLATTNASTFNFTASTFGLITQPYPSDASCPTHANSTQWQRLAHYIKTLNQHSPKNIKYTLFFLGRHGEGFHNAAESYFGTPAWNCYWSERDGNGTVTWADAQLTETGKLQALRVNAFWNQLIETDGIAPPDRFYTSPLSRCLDTARLTFAGVKLPPHAPFVPVVKEFLREGVSAHTCDRRSTKAAIRKRFPGFVFEKGFAEADPFWTPLQAEPQGEQDRRSKAVLDDVVGDGSGGVVSVTSHSGEIASLLRVLNHRPFSLSTGSAIPVLVKSTTLNVPSPPTVTLPYTPQKTCAAPPAIRDSSCNDCSCCS